MPAKKTTSPLRPSPRGQGRSEAEKNGIKSAAALCRILPPLSRKPEGVSRRPGEERLGGIPPQSGKLSERIIVSMALNLPRTFVRPKINGQKNAHAR